VTKGKPAPSPDYPAEFPSVMCGYEKENREAEAKLAIARKPANKDAPERTDTI